MSGSVGKQLRARDRGAACRGPRAAASTPRSRGTTGAPCRRVPGSARSLPRGRDEVEQHPRDLPVHRRLVEIEFPAVGDLHPEPLDRAGAGRPTLAGRDHRCRRQHRHVAVQHRAAADDVVGSPRGWTRGERTAICRRSASSSSPALIAMQSGSRTPVRRRRRRGPGGGETALWSSAPASPPFASAGRTVSVAPPSPPIAGASSAASTLASNHSCFQVALFGQPAISTSARILFAGNMAGDGLDPSLEALKAAALDEVDRQVCMTGSRRAAHPGSCRTPTPRARQTGTPRTARAASRHANAIAG